MRSRTPPGVPCREMSGVLPGARGLQVPSRSDDGSRSWKGEAASPRGAAAVLRVASCSSRTTTRPGRVGSPDGAAWRHRPRSTPRPRQSCGSPVCGCVGVAARRRAIAPPPLGRAWQAGRGEHFEPERQHPTGTPAGGSELPRALPPRRDARRTGPQVVSILFHRDLRDDALFDLDGRPVGRASRGRFASPVTIPKGAASRQFWPLFV